MSIFYTCKSFINVRETCEINVLALQFANSDAFCVIVKAFCQRQVPTNFAVTFGQELFFVNLAIFSFRQL